MQRFVVRIIVKLLLWLRYSIKIKGLKEIQKKGTKKIAFFPNHPALIDPVIMMSCLMKNFKPRPLADEEGVSRPIIRNLVKIFRPFLIPDIAKIGKKGKDRIIASMNEIVKGLQSGDNLLMYPSGHMTHNGREELGGSSGAHHIVKEVKDLRIVLVRIKGLWGSSFSWADGTYPLIKNYIEKYILTLLFNLFIFAPRRKVEVEFIEVDNFPVKEDRLTINKYLEEFYNKEALPNTLVPYFWWQGLHSKIVPEPEKRKISGDISHVSGETRQQVDEYLKELSGVTKLNPDDKLSKDLGLDSLTMVELMSWMGNEFGLPQDDINALQSVSDCYLAASGKIIGQRITELKPISTLWFKKYSDKKLIVPKGKSIPEVFLKTAKKLSSKGIIADQLAGVKTYKDMITAIMVLKPEIEKFPGDKIGIMLPASVTADILFLAVMFAGKTPVMVNWTVGEGNMDFSLNNVGVTHVLTASALLEKLKGQGFDQNAVKTNWIKLEELAKKISFVKKIKALLKSKISWSSLRKVKIQEIAAILFTSGSEANPKSVPLTHNNILSNVRAFPSVIEFDGNDCLLGILPPFHSFGLTGTVVLPLIMGFRTVYHANPTESVMLAKISSAYKASFFISTPTFFEGILRAADDKQLSRLHTVVLGAEKCPDYLFKELEKRYPNLVICEGYGITECSPVVSANRRNDIHPGTIGKMLPTMDHVIVDTEIIKRMPTGEQGLLLVKGPNVFSGYLGKDVPDPFIEFEGSKWYNTGDLVEEDENGIITFRGRLKRFIKLGGEMISLPAIEAALQVKYPATEDGPVIAVEATPSEDHPEVVLFTRIKIAREDANKVIHDAGLSALHNIRKIIDVNEIPVLGTGKTNYRQLKGMLE